MRYQPLYAMPVAVTVGLASFAAVLATGPSALGAPLVAARYHAAQHRGARATAKTAATAGSSPDQVSQNWAGLVQEGTHETSVSASWSAPAAFAAQTPPGSAVAEWVGLGGMKSSSLIQVGTVTTPGPNGAPETTVFWENLPNNAVTGATVAPGTTVSATISPDGTDKWQLIVTKSGDSTPLVDQVVSLTAAEAKGVETSADWITEAPSSNQGIVPLAPVSSTVMTHLLADGSTLQQMTASSLVTVGLAQGQMLVAAPTVNTAADTLTVNTVYGTLSPSPSGPSGSQGPGPGFIPLPPFGHRGFGWGNPWGPGFFGPWGWPS